MGGEEDRRKKILQSVLTMASYTCGHKLPGPKEKTGRGVFLKVDHRCVLVYLTFGKETRSYQLFKNV